MNFLKKRTFYNIVFGFGCQFIVIALGLIVPRIIMNSYGSDTNGLMGTVTQIFTYMALLEAGIGQATRNALYAPVREKNKEKVSEIMSTSRNYYRRMTVLYMIGVLILALSLPLVLKSELGYWTIFGVVFFEGLPGVITFWYVQNWTQLLMVEGKNYIRANVDMLSKVACYLIKILLASYTMNIVLIQFGFFVVSVIKLLFYKVYFQKHYAWIDFKAAKTDSKLPDKNSYILTEIAWTVFSSTDMIVLSAFCSTAMASVYSIYNMIYSNINILLNSVYQGTQFLLGRTFFKNKEEYALLHDTFNSVYVGIMTILMSVTYLLIIPFVQLYTAGVDDINYINNLLPLPFALVQLLSWSRVVGGNLTGIAGFSKFMSRVSIVEAITNIVLSIVLVSKFGIVGVVYATVAALPLKVIFVIYITEKRVLHRSCMKTLLILFSNYFMFGAVVFAQKYFDLTCSNYYEFFARAAVMTIFISIVVCAGNCIVNPKGVKLVLSVVGRKKER